MKHYHIEIRAENSNIRIINDDKEPVIKSIELFYYDVGAHVFYNARHRSIFVHLIDETEEIHDKFRSIPELSQKKGSTKSKSIIFQENMTNILEFFKVIQEVDPLPLAAFSEIMSHIDFDFQKFIVTPTLKTLVKDTKHEEALQLALQTDEKDTVPEALVFLANLYQEIDDEKNYYHVLDNIPEGHPFFVSAHEQLHTKLQTMVPETPAEKYDLLEKKLRHAILAGFTEEASLYFNELSGKTGLDCPIRNIRHVDSFVEIAKEQRALREEIEELKRYKALYNAGRAAHQRSKREEHATAPSSDPAHMAHRFFTNGQAESMECQLELTGGLGK